MKALAALLLASVLSTTATAADKWDLPEQWKNALQMIHAGDYESAESIWARSPYIREYTELSEAGEEIPAELERNMQLEANQLKLEVANHLSVDVSDVSGLFEFYFTNRTKLFPQE